VNIRRMLPIGIHLRKCSVCGEQQMAQSDNELTAHEVECIEKMLRKDAPERAAAPPSPVQSAPSSDQEI
jgi:hypothetical protein